MRTIWVLAIGLAAAGCGTNDVNRADGTANGSVANGAVPEPGPVNAAAGANAALRTADGQARGTATLAADGDGFRVAVAAEGMAAGTYGVHLHQVGRCDPPKFESAGPHWNPTSRQHGRDNPQGAHLGDLPNVEVGADGRGNVEFRIAGASITGGEHPLLDADGATVMIHARADDYRTDPSGDSGDRIVCGVLQAG